MSTNPNILEYQRKARTYARQFGIDEEVFHRLIQQESGWNPTITSSAGARGLGQLMPDTARSLGLIVEGDIDERTDPDKNLEAAARYFSRQLQKYGSYELALASYNAGPGAVDYYKGVPPFPETQNFVRSILQDRQITYIPPDVTTQGAPAVSLSRPPGLRSPQIEQLPGTGGDTTIISGRLVEDPGPRLRARIEAARRNAEAAANSLQNISRVAEIKGTSNIFTKAVEMFPGALAASSGALFTPEQLQRLRASGELDKLHSARRVPTPEYLQAANNLVAAQNDQLLANLLFTYYAASEAAWHSGEWNNFDDSLRWLTKLYVEGLGFQDASLLNLAPDAIRNILPPSDVKLLSDIFYTVSSTVPQVGDEAKYSDYLTRILQRPRPRPRLASALTVEEIGRALSGRALPSIPEGITTEQFTEMLRQRSADQDVIRSLEESRQRIKQLADEYLIQSATVAAFRQKLLNPDLPQPTLLENISLAAVQPALFYIETFDYLRRYVSQPSVGLATHVGVLPVLTGAVPAVMLAPLLSTGPVGAAIVGAAAFAGVATGAVYQQLYKGDIDKLFSQKKDELGIWMAAQYAFEHTDANAALKFMTEVAGDPLNILGSGGITAVTRRIPVIGTALGALELGWIRYTNLPFDVIGNALRTAKHIPLTPLQRSTRAATEAVTDLWLTARAIQKSSLGSISPPRVLNKYITELIKQGLEELRVGPIYTQLKRTASAGRHIFDAGWRYTNEAESSRFLRTLPIKGAKDISLTPEQNVELHQILREVRDKGGQNLTEQSQKLLRLVGINETKRNLAAAEKKLTSWFNDVYERGSRHLRNIPAGSERHALGLWMDQYRDTYLANLNSPVYKHLHKDGIVSSMMTKLSGTPLVAAANWIDRRIVYPFSRHFILFLNYGPLNVLESGYKTLLSGKNPFWFRHRPLDELHELVSHLPNEPLHLREIAENYLSKREAGQATELAAPILENITQHSGLARTQGKIPLVTRSVDIAVRDLPLIGRPAYNILRRLPQQFKSLRDWNNFWAEVGIQQQAWFILQEYKSQLAKISGDYLGDIQKALRLPPSELEKYLSKDVLDTIYQQVGRRALFGPEEVRALKATLGNLDLAKMTSMLDDLFKKVPHIPAPLQVAIRDAMMSGQVTLQNLDDFMKRVFASWVEQDILAKTFVQRAILKEMWQQISTISPTTNEEFIKVLRTLDSFYQSVQQSIHSINVAATLRGQELRNPKLRRDIHDEALDTIQEMLDDLRKYYDQLSNQLRTQIGTSSSPIDWSKVSFKAYGQYKLKPTYTVDITTEDPGLFFLPSIYKQAADQYGSTFGVTKIKTSTNISEPWKLEDNGATLVLNEDLLHYPTGYIYEVMEDVLAHKAANHILSGTLDSRTSSALNNAMLEFIGSGYFAPPSSSDVVNWSEVVRHYVQGDLKNYLRNRLVFEQARIKAGLTDDPDKIINSLHRRLSTNLKKVFGPPTKVSARTVSDMPQEARNIIIDMVNKFPYQVRANIKAIYIYDPGLYRISAVGSYNHSTRSISLLDLNPGYTSTLAHELGHAITLSVIDNADIPLAEKIYKVVSGGQNMPAVPPNMDVGLWIATMWRGGSEGSIGEDVAEALGQVMSGIERRIPVNGYLSTGVRKGKWTKKEALDRFEKLKEVLKDAYPAEPKKLALSPEQQRILDEWITLLGDKISALEKSRDVQLLWHNRTFVDKSHTFDEYVAAVREAFKEYDAVYSTLQAKMDILAAHLAHSLGQEDLSVSARIGPPVSGQLTASDIAWLYRGSIDDMFRMLIDPDHLMLMSKDRFVKKVLADAEERAKLLGKTAADFGYTEQSIGNVYDSLLDTISLTRTSPDDALAPAREVYRGLGKELSYILMSHRVDPKAKKLLDKWIDDVSDNLSKAKPFSSEENYTKWKDFQLQALEQANTAYRREFPDYTNKNAFDAVMKWIYPFWVYEAHRWPWLLRNTIQKPGLGVAWASYMENSDTGYLPLPGTDLQVNPLRGTIFAGGMRRLINRDFQEFYDMFPQMPTEILDYLSRAGFFPGIHIAAPMALYGARSRSVRPQVGELVPNWVQSLMSLIYQIPNETIRDLLTEYIFPNRYRDYQTVQMVNEYGGDGLSIYAKIKDGLPLTDEEQRLWQRARQYAVNVSGTMDAQFGLFRIRGKQQREAYEALGVLLEELTGIPKKQIDRFNLKADITGKRITDVIPLDPLDRQFIREFLEKYRAWLRPTTAPLLPSALGDVKLKIMQYYDDLEALRKQAYDTGFYTTDNQGNRVLTFKPLTLLENEFINGRISPDEYRRSVADTLGELSAQSRALANLPHYSTVPKTRREREQFYQQYDLLMPTWDAGQELLWEYYDLRPQLRPDEDGVLRPDWDTYFAQLDFLLESMHPSVRDRLLQRIQAEWTDTQRLYWTTSRKYLAPYRNVRVAVIQTYPEESQRLINRYVRADLAERQRIRKEVGPDGERIISDFEDKLRNARENLRILDPTLDAWLLFWGKTDKPLTAQAAVQYNELLRRYRPGAEPLQIEQ